MKMNQKSTFVKAAAFSMLISLSCTGLQAQRDRRHYAYPRYYPVRGQSFLHIPGPSLSIQFGGNPYYYSGGLFYQPFGNYYRILPPPMGIRVNVLPRGYWSFRIGGFPYFYYNGIFYQKNNQTYEVINAPVGAEVPSIPRDAKTVVIDGEKYYEYNGTYFKDFIKPNGELWYTVEGKHGVLNTDKTATENTQPQTIQNGPAIGEMVDQLPANAKTVVINGKKYFVSPDNVYYEEVIDGKQVRYRIAGK